MSADTTPRWQATLNGVDVSQQIRAFEFTVKRRMTGPDRVPVAEGTICIARAVTFQLNQGLRMILTEMGSDPAFPYPATMTLEVNMLEWDPPEQPDDAPAYTYRFTATVSHPHE